MLVLPFNRTDASLAASYTVFGKLPNRADFVRVNATHPAALEFDSLIQRAFERAANAPGSFDRQELSAAVDFQYVSRDQRHVMVGVLIPSQDQSGRSYPLVAAAILPGESVESYLPVTPIAYEVFFDGLRDQVINAVENSVEALACRQFLETNLRAYDTATEDLDLARSVVDRYMSAQPASRMSDLLEDGLFPASLQQALLNIAFYQAYLRRFDNHATNQLLLLPLSGLKGEQGLLASTWMIILSTLWSESLQGVPWSGSYLLIRRSQEGAQLIASVGRIPSSFGSLMLGSPIERDMLLDLGAEHEAWTSHRMYAESSYALSRVLADPACSLATLCTFLGVMSQQLAKDI